MPSFKPTDFPTLEPTGVPSLAPSLSVQVTFDVQLLLFGLTNVSLDAQAEFTIRQATADMMKIDINNVQLT